MRRSSPRAHALATRQTNLLVKFHGIDLPTLPADARRQKWLDFTPPAAGLSRRYRGLILHRRSHLVWSTKYRFKVLTGQVRLRVRDICRQVCRENDVEILRGVLSSDHVQMFVSVPPKLAISDLVRKMKGRSSHKVQREFPELRRRYWGRRFWGRGYFSTTNGAITEDIVLQYLKDHIEHPTGTSR